MPSALRRLVRGIETVATPGGYLNSPNWALEATETYVDGSPATAPVSWGTAAERDSQNQDFTLTTGAIQHLGALMTFESGRIPDGFGGVIVKVKPTYTAPEAPFIEVWTQDADTTDWTRRRAVNMSDLAVGTRSGEAKIFELLFSSQLENVAAVWVTMKPSSPLGSQVMRFLAIHLYGSCDSDVNTPDGGGEKLPEPEGPTEGPHDCEMDPTLWECEEPPAPGPVPFPPFTRTLHTKNFLFPDFTEDGYFCPQSRGISFFFGNIPAGGSIKVDVRTPGQTQLRFDQGTSQTISADGVMIWRVSAGTGYFGTKGNWPSNASNGSYLPPDAILEFTFTPQGDLTTLGLLDVLLFFFAAESLRDSEVC